MSDKSSSARQRKYRSTHRRIDYIPSTEVLAVIEQHRGIDNCIAGVIDQLILAGNKVITGNSRPCTYVNKC